MVASPTAGPSRRPDVDLSLAMSPDPDTLAKQRAQLAKRRANRGTNAQSEEISEADSAESGRTAARATAATAASDPTHPATLFATFSGRDAGERRAAEAASASALAVHSATARDDTLTLARYERRHDSARTDPPSPAPVPDHRPITVDLFAAVVLTLLAVGIVAVACVFPYQGLRDVAGDGRRWEVTLARWSVSNGSPRVPFLEGFYPTATQGRGGWGGGIEAYLPANAFAPVGSPNVQGGIDDDDSDEDARRRR